MSHQGLDCCHVHMLGLEQGHISPAARMGRSIYNSRNCLNSFSICCTEGGGVSGFMGITDGPNIIRIGVSQCNGTMSYTFGDRDGAITGIRFRR